MKSSFVLSILRNLYETGSAHSMASLLSATEQCINLENRRLSRVDCAALRFTLEQCTGVSLNLLWTSIPDGELQSIVPLLSHVSHLRFVVFCILRMFLLMLHSGFSTLCVNGLVGVIFRVDQLLLLRLLHCCSVPELQQGAAVLLSAVHHKLDFSCQDALDLTADTAPNSLVLSSQDCRVISMALQSSPIRVQLIIQGCEMEEAGVEELFPVLQTLTLQ